MREIKILEKNIQQVEAYMQANVEEIFVRQDQTKQEERDVRKTHDVAFEDLKAAREEANGEFDKMKSNKSEQEKITNEIENIQSDRREAERSFKDGLDAW